MNSRLVVWQKAQIHQVGRHIAGCSIGLAERVEYC